ncbi:hypothetical protein CupriaWKF_28760 [Cupriavidus sp. WKF15]|uniref:hypothetical protein n=1 Tax=Cupriavidus sp. WKF15 TaxID=3032282 RepID=UPI0023E1791A|nr:hypothetical protein [Cupriavidus sp. WKF15]WER48753.1 hypothetical protein CupriaWKF_28760 [Cupriavidus sp. WKF15]
MTRRSTDIAIAGRPVRLTVLVALLAGLLQLAGCAEMQMGQPKATVENATVMRGAGFAPVDVGRFVADDAKGSGMDRGVSIRSNSLRSPVDGSLAQYLRETLRVELASAGLLDPKAGTVVTGVLSDSEVNAPVGEGTASLGARFVVTRAGTVRYDKQLGVSAKWDSPFMGVSAIPQAAGQYEALYRKLVGTLLTDPAFRSAMREP